MSRSRRSTHSRTEVSAANDGQGRTRRVALFLLGTVTLLIIVAVASNAEQFTLGEVGSGPTRNVLPIEGGLTGGDNDAPEPDEPIEVPDNVVIVLAVVLGIAFLFLLSRQRFSFRFRRPSINLTRSAAVEITEEEQAEQIAEFARDLIDELNDGDSPRYAIQRAYAAVETGFGATEFTRKPAETPLRYLDRVFGRHASVKEPLADLTALFQVARFSTEPVTEEMRATAIASLVAIREYYTAISWKRINNRRDRRAKSAATR